MKYILLWLSVPLLITCVTEGMLALVFVPRKKRFILSLLLNIITNPLLNLVLAIVSFCGIKWVYTVAVALGECIVVIFEAFIYNKIMLEAFRKSLLISLILNIASFSVGFFIN